MTTETMRQITLPIKGMTCASCVSHVTHALEEAPGVEEATVNLATEKATVKQGLEAAMLGDLVRAVEDAGVRRRHGQDDPGHRGHDLRLLMRRSCGARPEGRRGRSFCRRQPGYRTGHRRVRTGGRWHLGDAPRVEDAGYSVVAVVGDEHDDAATPKDVSVLQRKFIFSLVVAGAIMALTAIPGVADRFPFRMDLLLLALATPVQFWAGRQFYAGAWGALKHHTAT